MENKQEYSELYEKVQAMSIQEKKEIIYEKYPYENVFYELSDTEKKLAEDFTVYQKLANDPTDPFGRKVRETFSKDYAKQMNSDEFTIGLETDEAITKVQKAVHAEKMEIIKKKRQLEREKAKEPKKIHLG